LEGHAFRGCGRRAIRIRARLQSCRKVLCFCHSERALAREESAFRPFSAASEDAPFQLSSRPLARTPATCRSIFGWSVTWSQVCSFRRAGDPACMGIPDLLFWSRERKCLLDLLPLNNFINGIAGYVLKLLYHPTRPLNGDLRHNGFAA
jgi:hypothetical protein